MLNPDTHDETPVTFAELALKEVERLWRMPVALIRRIRVFTLRQWNRVARLQRSGARSRHLRS